MSSMSPRPALTLAALAQRRPQFVDWGIRLDRAPACSWLGLQAAALIPTGIWMTSALRSGRNEPLGLLAVAVLAFFAWRVRRELRASPRLGWLLASALATLSATGLHIGIAGLPVMPPWVVGLLAGGALVCSLRAFVPQRIALAPLAALAMLAFPVLSSIKGAVEPWWSVARAEVLGRFAATDGPVDGVQLLWLGIFTACSVALWVGRGGPAFRSRLPWVAVAILIGFIVGDASWIGLVAFGDASHPWLRQTLGLLVPALTCGGIAALMAPVRRTSTSTLGGTHAARIV